MARAAGAEGLEHGEQARAAAAAAEAAGLKVCGRFYTESGLIMWCVSKCVVTAVRRDGCVLLLATSTHGWVQPVFWVYQAICAGTAEHNRRLPVYA